MPEKDEEKRCQYIIWNLLKLFEERDDSIPSSRAIRELLLETPRCDKFANNKLSGIRKAYIEYMEKHTDKDLKENIENKMKELKISEEKEEIAAATVLHYETWTQDQLRSCLSWKNWFSFQLLHKYERASSLVGLLTVGLLTFKGTSGLYKASMRKINKMRENKLKRDDTQNKTNHN